MSDDVVDFFAAPPQAGPGAAAPAQSAQTHVTPEAQHGKKKINLSPNLRLVVIGLIGVPLAIFMLKPLFFGGNTSSASGRQMNMPLTATQGAPRAQGPERQRSLTPLPFQSAASVVTRGDDEPDSKVSQPTSSASPIPSTVTSPNEDLKEVQAAIAQLNASEVAYQSAMLASVTGLKQSVDALTAQLKLTHAGSEKVEVPANAVARQKRPAPSQGKAPRAADKSKDADGKPSARMTLNTVYPGQAWIDAPDGTHVVGVGDMLGDVRIVAIDAVQRRVDTTAGVIR